MTSSPTSLASASRALPDRPESVISMCASCRPAIVEMPTSSHLVWSATTISRRAALTSARSVSASIRLGVVKPACVLIPCTPMNSMSTLSERIALTANGPTSASDGVRIPPVRTTGWSGRRRRTRVPGLRRVPRPGAAPSRGSPAGAAARASLLLGAVAEYDDAAGGNADLTGDVRAAEQIGAGARHGGGGPGVVDEEQVRGPVGVPAADRLQPVGCPGEDRGHPGGGTDLTDAPVQARLVQAGAHVPGPAVAGDRRRA